MSLEFRFVKILLIDFEFNLLFSEVKLTKDTYMIDNVPFNENWKPDRKRRKSSPCSSKDKS